MSRGMEMMACNFNKRCSTQVTQKTPTQVFSDYEYCKVFKNTCFEEHLRTDFIVPYELIVPLFTFNVIPLFTYVLECLQRHKRIEGKQCIEASIEI